MAPNPRIVNAFRAMRGLGIPEEKTKPVLKRLLKIYDKNWELIEEENYRALADAIFDSEESESAEQKKNLDNAEVEKRKELEQAERMKAIEEETQIQEEPERPLKRPLKRLRSRQQDGQASPSCINPGSNSSGTLLKRPKLEVDESQPELQKTTVTEPVRSNDSRLSPLKRGRNKVKQPNALIKPKDEPLTDEPPRLEVAFAESLTQKDASSENNLAKESDCLLPLTSASTVSMDLSNSVHATSNATSDHEQKATPDKSTTKLDIASSSSGEIKISLSCNSAHGKRKLSVSRVDTVLKTMEEKYLQSFKLLDPNFSMQKLMKDMCECLLDLGSNHTNEPQVGTDAIPPTDVLKTGNDCEKKMEQNGFEDNNHLTPDDTSTFDYLNDLAKGEESVIISLVNEVNSECPPSFHYIPRNAVFQNAYVNFSLSRIADDNCCSTCFGNCLTSSTPCPCALQSGGEFAYTIDGLVKEELLDECIKMNRDPEKQCLSYCKECPLEKSKKDDVVKPCKGHSARGFIKECWLKCGCHKKCGNRVVQCGIKHKLQVFMTSGGKGWGLRTLEDLPKGAFVCEFVGEVLTVAELYDRVEQNSNKKEYTHPVLLDADWGAENEVKEDEALCLDATYYGNVARFINHRCFDANLIEIPVEVENPDRHYYHLAFFTTRKVKALEELTRDYGIDFDDDDQPVKAFQCQCASRFCRNIRRSTRSRKIR